MRIEVEITQGELVGERRAQHQRFLGIPYAAPPVGARRFRAPAEPLPFDGVHEALAFGKSAPQPITGGVLPVGEQDEDCLYLNVYTPAADAGRRPVMCFIHGGAFFLGSAAEATYDGGPLAERGDVVVVTFNYRLGALGFLHLGDHGGAGWQATSNAGLLDQVAALRWVRDNISAFGGDPTAVTLFGQSAGAFSVAALLSMPAAAGLFKRAILQSGHAHIANPRSQAAATADGFLSALGLTTADPQVLQALPVDQILGAQAVPIANNMRALAPVIDGQVLPQLPYAAVRGGASHNIPMLIGTTRDETKLYIDPKRKEIDDPTLVERAARFASGMNAPQVQQLLAVYRTSRKDRELPHGNQDLLDALATASGFRIPALRLAETHAQHQPRTFVYEFTWSSPARKGTMGAVHALELPFVFGTLGKAMERLTGPVTEELVALSDRMMAAWLAFAKHGNPSCEAVGTWPAYDRDERSTMVFDLLTQVVRQPFETERAQWEKTTT